MSRRNTPGYVKISKQYRMFRQNLYGIWESYNLVDFYSKILREDINRDKKPLLISRHLKANKTKTYDKNNTLNLLDRFHQQETPKRVLVESVSLFENFIGDLVSIVYNDYPVKLLGKDIQNDSPEHRKKILEVVVKSNDRDEILEKIIEEKVRSLFYKKLSDIFIKDKSKLDFGDFFSKNEKAIFLLEEIMARRNIIVHNGGKVDRKYLREVKKPEFNLNQSVQILPEYLQTSIVLLESLGAVVSFLILRNVYKRDADSMSKKMQQSYTFFERKYSS